MWKEPHYYLAQLKSHKTKYKSENSQNLPEWKGSLEDDLFQGVVGKGA